MLTLQVLQMLCFFVVRRIYLFLILFVVLGVGLVWVLFINGRNVAEEGDGVELKEVVMENTAVPTPFNISYSCQKGKNVLELLKANASVEGEEGEGGMLVRSINGQSEGGGRFWIYSVDGVSATESASSYNCLGEEKISWELR